MNLNSFYVEFEVNKHGNLFCTDTTNSLRINNSSEYPVTHGILKEYKKGLNKEVAKVLKADNMHTMITVMGYDYSYITHAFHRFTFDKYNGKVYVETRPYVKHEGFPVEETIEFDNDKQAKEYIVNTILMYAHDNINVKPNQSNYFTKDM